MTPNERIKFASLQADIKALRETLWVLMKEMRKMRQVEARLTAKEQIS